MLHSHESGRSLDRVVERAPGTVRRRWIEVALMVALCGAPGGLVNGTVGRAQAMEDDFYRHGSDTVHVVIYLDSLGIVARSDVTAEAIEAAVSRFDLSPAGQLPEPVLVFGLPQPLSRSQLHQLGRDLEASLDSLISKAGPLVAIGEIGTRVAVTDHLIIQFADAVTQNQIDSLNNIFGVELLVRTPFEPNHFLARVTARSPGDALAVSQIYHDIALVESVYPNFLGGAIPSGTTPDGERFSITENPAAPVGATIPFDPLFSKQWHLQNTGQLGGIVGADVKAVDAWDFTLGNPNTVIAIIETAGFDLSHPDLSANLWHNPGEVGGDLVDNDGNGLVDDVHGWNFGGTCLAVTDPNSVSHTILGSCGDRNLGTGSQDHGTAVAGLAAAVGDNGIGVTGMCPQCRLMLIRTSSSWYGKLNAFLYARDEQVSVINASLHMIVYGPIATAIVSAANSGPAGIPVVFSVRNKGEDECADFFTSLPEVIAVGSSDNHDRRRKNSGFGSCLDLLAPGGLPDSAPGITTTDVTGAPGYNPGPLDSSCMITQGPDQAYTFCFSGASAAAPIVSGIAGLLRSVNPTMTRQAIQKVLEETADKIDPGNAMYDVNGFSLTYGYGRVNAYEALKGTVDVTPEPEEEDPDVEFGTRLGMTTLSGGANDQAVANLPGGGPFSSPILYAALFPANHWMIEGQLGFSYTSNSSAPNESRIVAAIQPAYLLSGSSVPSAYLGANVAARRFDVGGNVSTDTGSGIALGYRFLPFSFLAVRTEARYRYWFTDNISEFGVALAFGVVLGTTP